MDKYIGAVKRLFVFLARTVYIGFFFIAVILLLKNLYFPDHVIFPGKGSREKASADASMIEKIESNEDGMYRGHFHVADEYVPRLGGNPHLCQKCHGVYPHIKDEKNLAFLNLHSGFMSCEVCHNRRGPEARDHYFTWADRETGKTSMRVKGGYGKYNAVIVPVRIAGGKQERLDELVSARFAEAYERSRDRLYIFKEDEEAELREIHEENLSKKPVSCDECHSKGGYMDFARLGFPQYRINQLASSEVSRMMDHYKTFYIPKMLMPR